MCLYVHVFFCVFSLIFLFFLCFFAKELLFGLYISTKKRSRQERAGGVGRDKGGRGGGREVSKGLREEMGGGVSAVGLEGGNGACGGGAGGGEREAVG